VFDHARVTFVMSEGMKLEWESLYPGVQFQPLVHTFDGPVPPLGALPPLDRSRIRLGYLGLVSQANLDALQRIVHVVHSSEDLYLNIYSGSPAWQLEKQGLCGLRIRHEQPTDAMLQDALQSQDILLLPHGLTGGLAPIEYRTIFPTRTIPYLLSGRPILAHSARGSFLSRWIKQHDCAELVEEPDAAALRKAIDRLCDNPARREQLVRNALAAAENFRAEHVVDNMKRTINRFLNENRSGARESSWCEPGGWT
jgi:glycosyltransferase involved in cell wall biosynthesis